MNKLIIQTKAQSKRSEQRSRDLEMGFFSLVTCSWGLRCSPPVVLKQIKVGHSAMYKVVFKHFSPSCNWTATCGGVWTYPSWSLQENGFSVGHLQRGQGMGLLPHLTSGKPSSLWLSQGEELQDRSGRRLGSATLLLPKVGIGPKHGKTQSPASRKAGLSICSEWWGPDYSLTGAGTTHCWYQSFTVVTALSPSSW